MNKSLSKFKTIASLIVFISAILENIFFFGLQDFYASIVLIYGWVLIKSVVLTSGNLKLYPVSFLMVLGLSIFHFVLPMPLTLLEFKPVTYNLRVPFLTFSHQFLFVTIIVFTHFIYTKLSNGKNIFRSVLNETNFYVQPTDKIIWITALLGLFASFYNYFIFDAWQKEAADRNFLYYINSIMSQFIWMPMIIPFSKFRGIEPGVNKKNIRNIFIYSIFVFVVAIASNWRTVLFSGILILFGMFFIGFLLQYYNLKKIINPRKIVLIFGVILFITGPLIDLGYSMVIVRHDRGTLSTVDFLSKTISTFNDKDLLDKAKAIGSNKDGVSFIQSMAWDENYLHNIVANRFVNLKISDNSLFYAEAIGFKNQAMQDELVNQVVAFTPNLILNFFDFDVSKKVESSKYSIGDFLYSLAINDSNVRGSAVVSSMPGVGMAIFGYWYLAILVPIFLVIFSMFDSFVKVRNNRIVFSYFFFLMLVSILNYFNDRHVYTYEFKFIIRTYAESILLFLMVMKIIKFSSSLSINKRNYT